MKPLPKFPGLLLLLWVLCISASAQVRKHSKETNPEPLAKAIVKQKQEEPVTLPVGVSQDWYEHSVDQIQKREYFIQSLNQPANYVAANSKQRLGFMFTPEGYSVRNITGDEKDRPWQSDFQFKGIVRSGQTPLEQKLTAARNQENTLEYDYTNYTVQYINDVRGMRQNFIVKTQLPGKGNLEVLVDLAGDLEPKMKNNGHLVMYDGKIPQLIYDEIKVWDATNRPLAASMRIHGDNHLILSVDDENAVYPLTIDPLNHAPNWTDSGSGLVFSLLDDLSAPLLYGFSVSGAGDLNGDGYDDVVIGAPAYVDVISVSGGTFNTASVGAAFIYFGSASGLSANPAEILQPTSEVGALFGFSVSGAGDVNGDGRADVVVGAPGDKVSATVGLATVNVAVGKVYIYYGTQFDGNINTEPTVAASVSLKQSDLGVLLTTPINALYGFSVSSAGDVNGDGKSDIVVGSPAYIDLLSLNLAGRVDVYHGSASGIGASPSRTITGGLLNGLFGYTVSTAGKVNNDSYDDIIVGAPASINLIAVGAAYVFHGSATGITATSASAANTSLNAPGLLSKTLFGYSVSAAGDVNADGRGDVIIGEPLALDLFSGSLVAVGRAHIFYGSTTGIQSNARTQLTSPRKPGLLGLITGNLLFGFSVSGVKDINCDGVDDVIIGEPGGTSLNLGTGLLGLVSTNAVSGQAYIFYGKNSTGPIDNPGYTYFQSGAISAANLIGYSVKSSGDVNGDGKPDFLIGAPNGTLNLSSSLTGILGNTLGYLTTNSVGSTYGFHGCINSLPVAVNDVATTNEDTPVIVNVTANDTDADGSINTATVDLNTATAGIQNTITTAAGTWTVNATGEVTYTPALNYNGSASISYNVKDNSGAVTNNATLTVTVVPVNDLPVAVNDNTTTPEDTPVILNIVANDTDVDGTIDAATVDLDPATVGTQGSFTNSSGTWSVSAGILTFAPAHDFNGAATVSYTVKDNEGGTSNTATVAITVTPVNDAPVAVNDNVTTAEDTPVLFSVTANDTDVDGTIDAATVDLNPLAVGTQNTLSNTSGTWSVNPTGNVTYTPALDFNGTASITYTVKDNSGTLSNIATISVTVTPINDAPVAVNDTPSTPEDTPVVFNVILNDTDVDGNIDPATVDLNPATPGIQNTITNASGTWTVDATGNVTYTPTANFNGNASISYVVKDDSGTLSNTATITVSVIPVNDAPVAVNDTPSTNEDTPASFSVVVNDTDIDGTINPATVDLNPSLAGIQSTLTNASGSWSANASGSVTYTPALNFNGPAIITYTVNDNSGATSNVATITVTVNPVNDAPVAVNDNQVTNEDTPVAFSIVANDSDIDGTIDAATVDLDPSTGGIQSTLTTTTGTWSVNASGLLTYTPVLNFNGSTSITYTVRDNSGTMSNVATISVTVNSVNDAPVAVNDNLSGGQNTPLTFNVTANDKDVDGTIDPATVDLDPATAGTQSTFNNAAGNWSVDASGNVTFTPLAPFTGTSSITYTVKDNSGTLSNAGTISVNIFAVAPANVAPVAVNDNSSTNQNVAVTFNVTANDTDSDGTINAASVDLDLATAGVQNNFVTAAGTWNVISTGYLTFTPTAVFFGTASLSYKVNDNSGTPSNAATISVAVNAAPVAVNDSPVTNEDTPVTFSVTANDTDADGPINTASVDLDPATAGLQNTLTSAAGTWTVNVSGNVTFTPVLNFNGNPSITYTIKDGNGATSNVATISVTVTPVNDAPVAVNDNSTTNEDNLVSFSVTINDTDVDGSINVATVDLDQTTAGIQATKNTTAGSWSVNATGTVTFTPALNFNGTASITYTVNDNGSLTSNVATISVTVNPVNDAPVAVNDTPVTDEDTPIVFNVTLNDTDVDGTIDDSTVDLNPALGGIQTSITNAGGTWSVDVNGNVTFTPALNFTGPASVTYTVKDNSGTVSNTGTITVTVTPVNDAPVAVNDNIATSEDVAITIPAVANDTDADGTINATTVDLDPALAGIQSMLANASGSWTANATGSIVFTPVADFNGAATATYTVNDNSGATSNIATITVTVTPVNDAPVAINDNPVTNEDTAITFSVVANDTDADGTIDAATVDLDPITAGIQTSFTNLTGNWVVSPTGNVTFTPALNFHGTGSITYEVNDNSGLTSNTATISVTVNSVNDAPVAVNDNLITDANVSITFHVTTNDTDVDGTIDASTIDLDPIASGIQTIITSALKGVWEVNTAGAVTFTPVLGFFGSASIDYTVKDNEGALSNTATIAVTVNWVNTSPVALDDSESTEQGKAVSFNIAVNDLDVDANLDLTSIHLIATPGSSARSFLSADGSWDVSITGQVTFQPNADFVGLAIVKYTITDIMGLISNEAEVKVTVTPAPKNDFITGLAKSVSTPELQADGRSKLIFTFTAKNLGTEDANSIQITDDLTLAFPAPASYTIVSGSANGNLIYNTSFNGSGDTNLLATGSKLLAGTTQQVILTVLVNPNGKPGSFTNAALVTVKSDDNTVTYTDHSDEGTNPDSNGNGNPGDPGEDDSTIILLPSSPSVVVSKELAMEPVKKSDCTYDVTLKVMIKNTGNVDFTSISLTDNLDMGIIAPADFTIINVISSDVQVNIGFDGKQDKNLLASGTPLHHGDSIEVVYTVNITPNDFFGPYFNIITAKTTDANGTVSEYQSKSVEFHIVPQEVWIPEGFSPNGDGVHDLFEITLSCGLKAKLTVFNRWGERVYQSNDYQNDWGGQSNHGDFMDKLLPEGTYFFTCELSSGTKTTSFITIKN